MTKFERVELSWATNCNKLAIYVFETILTYIVQVFIFFIFIQITSKKSLCKDKARAIIPSPIVIQIDYRRFILTLISHGFCMLFIQLGCRKGKSDIYLALVTCFLKVFEDTEDADETEAIKAVEKSRLFDLRVTSGLQVSELSYLQSALPLSVFQALRFISQSKKC